MSHNVTADDESTELENDDLHTLDDHYDKLENLKNAKDEMEDADLDTTEVEQQIEEVRNGISLIIEVNQQEMVEVLTDIDGIGTHTAEQITDGNESWLDLGFSTTHGVYVYTSDIKGTGAPKDRYDAIKETIKGQVRDILGTRATVLEVPRTELLKAARYDRGESYRRGFLTGEVEYDSDRNNRNHIDLLGDVISETRADRLANDLLHHDMYDRVQDDERSSKVFGMQQELGEVFDAEVLDSANEYVTKYGDHYNAKEYYRIEIVESED